MGGRSPHEIDGPKLVVVPGGSPDLAKLDRKRKNKASNECKYCHEDTK